MSSGLRDSEINPNQSSKQFQLSNTAARFVCAMFLVMVRRFLGLTLLLLGVSGFAKPKYQPLPVRLDRDGEKWAQKTLRKMSLEEKIGQLFMIWTRAEFL